MHVLLKPEMPEMVKDVFLDLNKKRCLEFFHRGHLNREHESFQY